LPSPFTHGSVRISICTRARRARAMHDPVKDEDMRRATYLIGSVLTVVISVAATMFVASITAQAAPAAHDLPSIITTMSVASSAPATVTPSPSVIATSTPSGTQTARPSKPKPRTSPRVSTSQGSSSDRSDDDDDHETVKEHLHESDGNEHSDGSDHSDRDD